MSDLDVTLRAAAGLKAMLQRFTRTTPAAEGLARFSSVADGVVDVFVQTPFATLASRRVQGVVSRDGAVVKAADLLDAFDGVEVQASLSTCDFAWAGALPPSSGFVLIDEIPVAVAHDLATQGQALARQFSGPMGPPASLLDNTVLTVTSEDGASTVEISMREIFTCTSLGFIPNLYADDTTVPRHLRVAKCGRWVRIDAPFGSVYKSSGLSLLL